MDGRSGMMKSGMKFDPAARADQHLTRLKAELKPTAQQEPLWNAYAEKVKAESGSGMEAMHATMQNDKLTAPERMAAMNAMMKNRLASHEAVTDSFKRLYDSLTPEQKTVADQLMSRMGAMERGNPGRQGPAGTQGKGGEGEHRHG
jgi:Spy/CpxP family protein refolding chaperone